MSRETSTHADTGCKYSPSCLACPLPVCKEDDPLWFQRNRQMVKDLTVWATMQRERLTAEAAAERFSLTTRTIFRIMARCREYTRAERGSEAMAHPADMRWEREAREEAPPVALGPDTRLCADCGDYKPHDAIIMSGGPARRYCAGPCWPRQAEASRLAEEADYARNGG